MPCDEVLEFRGARDLTPRSGSPHISTSLQPVYTVESIAAFDAKTRLSELLDRAARGETFEITKHGRPVGKLGPPDSARDPIIIAEAVARLKLFRGALKGATPNGRPHSCRTWRCFPFWSTTSPAKLPCSTSRVNGH